MDQGKRYYGTTTPRGIVWTEAQDVVSYHLLPLAAFIWMVFNELNAIYLNAKIVVLQLDTGARSNGKRSIRPTVLPEKTADPIKMMRPEPKPQPTPEPVMVTPSGYVPRHARPIAA